MLQVKFFETVSIELAEETVNKFLAEKTALSTRVVKDVRLLPIDHRVPRYACTVLYDVIALSPKP